MSSLSQKDFSEYFIVGFPSHAAVLTIPKCSTELNICYFIFNSYHSHYYCFCYLLVREVLEFTKYRVDFLYWYWFLWFSSKLLVGLETRINTRASDKVSRNSFIAEQMQGWSSDHQKQRVTLETFNQSDKNCYFLLNWHIIDMI